MAACHWSPDLKVRLCYQEADQQVRCEGRHTCRPVQCMQASQQWCGQTSRCMLPAGGMDTVPQPDQQVGPNCALMAAECHSQASGLEPPGQEANQQQNPATSPELLAVCSCCAVARTAWGCSLLQAGSLGPHMNALPARQHVKGATH